MCVCVFEQRGGDEQKAREQNETSLSMCEIESERLRQREKTGELMSD